MAEKSKTVIGRGTENDSGEGVDEVGDGNDRRVIIRQTRCLKGGEKGVGDNAGGKAS